MKTSYKLPLGIGTMLVGLFSGCVGFLLLVSHVLRSYPEYALVMKKLIQASDSPPLIPAMVVLSLVCLLVTLVCLRRQTHSRVFVLTLIAFGCFLVMFLLTLGGSVPLGTIITSWNSQTTAPNWEQVRDQWTLLDLIRFSLSLASLICLLFALLLPGQQRDQSEM